MSWRAFVTCLAILALISAVALVVVTPPGNLLAPRSGARDYDRTPLGDVLVDLEENGIIPNGTTWDSDALRERPVTTSWLFPRDKQALHMVAISADVIIEIPLGTHAQIVGPVTVCERGSKDAGLYVRGHRVQP
jgi:hypothetical protein